jgi:hypothetical protein
MEAGTVLDGGASFGGSIDMRVSGTVVATAVVLVVCTDATLVVDVDEGAGARVVEVVDEVDELEVVEEVVDEVVVDGAGRVVVVAGAEVTEDDVVVWA